MLRCPRCKLDITGAPSLCPLCQGPLLGEPDAEGGVFVPLEGQSRKASLVFSIITMAALAVSIIALAADYLIFSSLSWSILVVGGTACAWVLAVIGWKKRRELAKNILIQTTLISIVALIWDLSSGWQGWSLNYVFPCVCVAAIAALSVLALVLQLDSSEYMAYLWLVSVYGIIPFIFVLTKLVTVLYPSVICCVICALTLAALLLFFRRSSVAELKKKLHL